MKDTRSIEAVHLMLDQVLADREFTNVVVICSGTQGTIWMGGFGAVPHDPIEHLRALADELESNQGAIKELTLSVN